MVPRMVGRHESHSGVSEGGPLQDRDHDMVAGKWGHRGPDLGSGRANSQFGEMALGAFIPINATNIEGAFPPACIPIDPVQLSGRCQ